MKHPTINAIASRLRLNRAGLPQWTQAILLVLIAISLVQLSGLLLPAPNSAAAPHLEPVAPVAILVAPRLEAVANLHLFGAATPVGFDSLQANAPATSLNLTLHGLFASTDKQRSFAIIADGSGADRYYRIGATVGGSASVRDILADRVVLERAGGYETLHLPKERLGTVGNAASAPAPRAGVTLPAEMSEQLRMMLGTLRGDPKEILNIARFEVVMHDGQRQGYRIEPRQHAEIFRAMGLTPGDVVTAVNGTPLKDPTHFANLASQLTLGAPLQLSVQHPDGSSEELHINPN